VAVDAISRRPEVATMTAIVTSWNEEILVEGAKDDKLSTLLDRQSNNLSQDQCFQRAE